jgi:hypothetical protein
MKKVFTAFFLSFLLAAPAAATTLISPIVQLEADPGSTTGGVVKLYNETANNIFLTADVEQFTTGDQAGTPIFLPEENKEDFLSWFSLAETELLLLPGQVAVIPFEVVIPQNAVPGGYYAAIFWRDVPAQGAGQPEVAVTTRVGTLVLLKVNGAVVESGEVLSFDTTVDQDVFFGLPVGFQVRFANTGNVHIQPQATVTLTNFFGQKHSLALTDGKQSVLPQTTRQFEVFWGSSSGNSVREYWNSVVNEFKNFSIGPYKAELTLSYGLGNQEEVRQELSFWVMPLRLLSVVFGALALLLLGLKFNSKMNKLKKKHQERSDAVTKEQ